MNRRQQCSKNADGKGDGGRESHHLKPICLLFCTASLTRKSPEELSELSNAYLPVAFQAIKLFLWYHLIIGFFVSVSFSFKAP